MCDGAEAVSLREHFESLMREHKDAQRAEIDALKLAVAVAKDSMEKRLDALNELRQMVIDQQAKFYSREAHDAYAMAVEARLKLLETAKANMDGRILATGAFVGAGVTIVNIAISIVLHLWKP